VGGWVGESKEGGGRGKRGKGGKGILLRVPFGVFFFFWKGGCGVGGRSITFFTGFFLVSVGKEWGGIEFFFLGEEGDLLYICRTRRGGRELGF